MYKFWIIGLVLAMLEGNLPFSHLSSPRFAVFFCSPRNWCIQRSMERAASRSFQAPVTLCVRRRKFLLAAIESEFNVEKLC
jgi:hypothetical protein